MGFINGSLTDDSWTLIFIFGSGLRKLSGQTVTSQLQAGEIAKINISKILFENVIGDPNLIQFAQIYQVVSLTNINLKNVSKIFEQ